MPNNEDEILIFEDSEKLSEFIYREKNKGKKIGFTPTMGALHDGHFSLIRRSLAENDVSICSIFVNPTQFNVPSDLVKYPRTIEKDIKGLRDEGCPVVFIPSSEDIYPNGSDYKVEVDLKGLDEMMEGKKRPGHFEGVVQVVKRLLEITSCDHLYMGQKDYQQFTIIKEMIKDLEMPVKLVVCPILRDEDGLAKSSRNTRLTESHRRKAPIIFRVLTQAKDWLSEGRAPVEISMKATEYLNIQDFKPEYFDLIDGHTLEKVRNTDHHALIVACTAVWAGTVRLIDNMILKGEL